MTKKKPRAKKRPVRVRKMRSKKYELLIEQTIQGHTHLSTEDIISKRDLVAFAQNACETRISQLMSQLNEMRRQKNDRDAVLFGLGVAIARR